MRINKQKLLIIEQKQYLVLTVILIVTNVNTILFHRVLFVQNVKRDTK